MTLNFTIFRSTDPKGQLSYYHHIASVFCCTSYFGNISSFDLLWTIWLFVTKLCKNDIWKVLNKTTLCCSYWIKNMTTMAILVSDWPSSTKSYLLKLLGQKQPDFAGLMLKCIQQNHPHFIVIWETTWVSKAYLIKMSTLTWSPILKWWHGRSEETKFQITCEWTYVMNI